MILLVPALALSLAAQAPPASPMRPVAPRLTAEQVLDLEKSLEKDPEVPGLRVQAMQFYFQNRQREPFLRHLTWLVEHAAASPATSMGYSMLFAPAPGGQPLFTPEDITSVKSAYDRQVQANPKDVSLALSASMFFENIDIRHSEEILKKAHQANPGDESLEKRLARVYVQCIVRTLIKMPPGRSLPIRDAEGVRALSEQAQKELASSENKVLVGEAERVFATVPVERPQFAGVKDIRDRVSAQARKLGIESPVPLTEAGMTIRPDGRVRVTPALQKAKLIKSDPPVYPEDAKAKKIESAVRFEVIIDKDGTTNRKNLKLLGGDPLLVEAAEEALSKWQWKPTISNGQPVEVVTSVDVEFKLP